MLGIGLLIAFAGGGIAVARFWLPRVRPLVRGYVGASMGLLLFLWLPVLWAYVGCFDARAHWLALAAMAALVGAAFFTRDRRAALRFGEEDRRVLRTALCVVVPLVILAGYLEYTHSIRPASDGGYHVGQSTYGDLSLHLAVATSIVGAKFPLQNSLMLGATMAYPYLADSFASSLLVFGMELPAAMTVTGTIFCAMVFWGYALLCAQLCKRRGAMVLAVCLLFLNGGLGFFYTLSSTVENGVVTGLWDNLKNVLTGYYQTPTNLPDPYNLRWVNVICDMLIPQRGILGGWSMLMPALNLLIPPLAAKRRFNWRELTLLGVIAGGMPLLHTHSFLALALFTLGAMAYVLLTTPRGERVKAFKPFLLFGYIAAALSLPQLICFTFVQATGSDHFLRFQFNWCNNRGGNGLVEPYFWFYIKNIGVAYLLILFALFQRRAKGKAPTDTAFYAIGNESDDGATDAVLAEGNAQGAAKDSADVWEAFAEDASSDEASFDEASADEAGVDAAGADRDDAARVYASDGITPNMPVSGASAAPATYSDAIATATTHCGMSANSESHASTDAVRAQASESEITPNASASAATAENATAATHCGTFANSEPYTSTDAARAHASENGMPPNASPIDQSPAEPALSDDFASPLSAGQGCSAPLQGAGQRPAVPIVPTSPVRDFVRQNRLIACGAFLILLVAELVLFQPNEYDNNKLILVWFLLCLPMAANYAWELWERLRGLGGRRLIATGFLIVSFLSAGLTVARECVSDYSAYDTADLAAAEFVKAETPAQSVFLTGNQHLNPVASLAGRTILCGSDLYLYYHGFNTTARKAEVRDFYEFPRENLDLLVKYGVQYIYVSPSERYNYDIDEGALRELFTVVYDEGSRLVLEVDASYRADPALDPASEG